MAYILRVLLKLCEKFSAYKCTIQEVAEFE